MDEPTDRHSLVFVVDTEATSRTPMSGIMTEFAVVHLVTGESFYAHLYRSHPHPDIPALPVADTGEDGQPLAEPWWARDSGDETAAVHEPGLAALAASLARWLERFELPRRVLVSDNNGFDAMWLNCFTDAHLGELLFGHSSRRIGDYWAGTRGKFNDQSSWKSLRRTRHTHHPLDDARGNVEALRVMLGLNGFCYFEQEA